MSDPETVAPLAHTPACFGSHMGTWMIEPGWGAQALASIRSGVWKPGQFAAPSTIVAAAKTVTDPMSPDPEYPDILYSVTDNGIAVVDMTGAMAKAKGKYASVGTVQKRRALRMAAQDGDVQAILLSLDSPGGTTAGTQQLADEVRAADAVKPVFAHIEDMGASAAYWVASQTRRVTANQGAMVGSLGTLMVLEDTSEQAKMEGIKVHVISTGPYKGTGADGAPITPEQLAYAQSMVDSINQIFMQAVAGGRRKSMDETAKLFDGRVHMAAAAKSLGLIDAVQSIDQTLAEISASLPAGSADANKRRVELARARGGR